MNVSSQPRLNSLIRFNWIDQQIFGKFGDPLRTRTPNLLIRSQLLYPVELRDRWCLITQQAPGGASETALRGAIPCRRL